MPVRIPFQPSENNYRMRLSLSQQPYLFDVHWNSRDAAWYFDIRADDETPILLGIKAVLAATIGKRSTHDFFKAHLLTLVDTSGLGIDAGFDDLGGRIQLLVSDGTETS